MSGLLTLIFVWQGGTKLLGHWKERFQRWGYPILLAYLVGAGEIAASAGIWLEEYSYWASLWMYTVVIAGIMTQTRYYEDRQAYYWPLGTLALLLLWSIIG